MILPADAAEDAAAAVTEEENSNREAAREPRGTGDGEEQAGPPEELKVVASIKEGTATIGVQQPKSDPHIESFDDHDLSGLAQEVAAVTVRARAKWETEPRYPAHVRPAPRPSVRLAGSRGRDGLQPLWARQATADREGLTAATPTPSAYTSDASPCEKRSSAAFCAP